jgi:hypothetical protein
MRTSRSIAHQLKAVDTALHNTLADAELAALAAQYGYDTARLDEGRALHTAATLRMSEAVAARGLARERTRASREADKMLRDAVKPMAVVARAIFRGNEGILTMLGVDGAVPRDQAGFLLLAGLLFRQDLPGAEVTGPLASHGFGAAALTQGHLKLEAAMNAKARQADALGLAHAATHAQATAMKALNAWAGCYFQIMRVALREHPEWLAKLGVPVRLEKTPAQRAGPAKAAATRRRNRESREALAAAA